MSLQKRKEFGSTSSLSSRGSLSNLLKDGVDNLEDSVTKKWLSWILRFETGIGIATALALALKQGLATALAELYNDKKYST